MNTKLTLSIDQKIVESAKKKLKLSRTSISKVVENYLKLLVLQDDVVNESDTPILNELMQVVDKKDMKIDTEKEIVDYLLDKYK